MAALVVTFELGQELIHPSRRRAGPGLVAATLIALAVGLGVAASIKLEDRAQGLAFLGALAFGAGGLAALYGILKSAPRIVYAAAAAASTALLLGVVVGAPKLIAEARSAAPLVAAVPALQSARPLVLVDMNLPSLTYYTDRVAEKVHGRALPERLGRGDDPLVVLDAADWAALPADVRGRLRELGRSGKLRAFDSRPGAAP